MSESKGSEGREGTDDGSEAVRCTGSSSGRVREDPSDGGARGARFLGVWGSVLGGAGVLLGAFGAHALQNMVAPRLLAIFETAVRYQLIHALLLLILVPMNERVLGDAHRHRVGRLILAGTILFSGSLYLRVILDVPRFGMITPVGGVLLVSGWVALARSLSAPSPKIL